MQVLYTLPYTSPAKNAEYKVIYYSNEVEEFENRPCCRQVALTDALFSIIMDTDILLMDEPFGAIDTKTVLFYKNFCFNFGKETEQRKRKWLIPQRS